MGEAPAHEVLFLGTTYAGHGTRFRNLKSNTATDQRISAKYRAVTGWDADGKLERLPFVPKPMIGRVRALREAAAFAAFPRPDAIWLSAPEVVTPYLWSQFGRWRRPVVLDLDATPGQLDAMSRWYFGRKPKGRARRSLGTYNDRLLRRTVSAHIAWSRWAAGGVRALGVNEDAIHVIPPGVDLASWKPVEPKAQDILGRPLRLLFVGGDFKRKGGDLLLDILDGPLGSGVEADIVTRDPVICRGPVRVHRAEPNSEQLMSLYAQADVFVLPTRAECFGIAAVEAMAAGLPVVMGDIGGARDIVEPGETGWLIEPTAEALGRAVRTAIESPELLRRMGVAARSVAETRFDGRINDRKVVDVVLNVIEAGRSTCSPSAKGGAC